MAKNKSNAPGKYSTKSKPQDNAKGDEFTVFGHTIGTWSTAISLILSIGAIVLTTYAKFFAQPHPHLYPPNAVEIGCQQDPRTGNCDPSQNLYIVAASLVWTNQTDSVKSYVVSQSYVEITFFQDRRDDSNPSKKFISTAELYGFNKDEAVPLQIAPQQFFAQRTYFYPRRTQDGQNPYAIPFSVFKDGVINNQIRRVHFRFYSELEGGGTAEAACDYQIDDEMVSHLSDPTIADYPRTCFPVKT